MYLIPQAGQQSRANSSAGPRCWPMRLCRIAGRFSSWCLSSCWASAQPWQRCSSFFWLLTMSVRCTVAGFEQSWHFTPLPFLSLVARACVPPAASTLFQPADAVAEPGGLLVGLLVDRLEQLLAQLQQLGLRL